MVVAAAAVGQLASRWKGKLGRAASTNCHRPARAAEAPGAFRSAQRDAVTGNTHKNTHTHTTLHICFTVGECVPYPITFSLSLLVTCSDSNLRAESHQDLGKIQTDIKSNLNCVST